MKTIITLFIAAITIVNVSFAQNYPDKILLNKNQKLITSTTSNGTVSFQMMGQSMETTSESTVNTTVDVKDVTPVGYLLTNTVNKMKIKTTGGMAPPVDFDSDKKEDINSEIGKSVSGNLQPTDLEITFTGKPVEKKNMKDEEDMAKVMQSIMSGTGDNGITGVFMLIPAGKKIGNIWADSSNENGVKIKNTYTLKQVNGNDASVSVTTISNINKTVNSQGAELTVTMDSKISSDNIVELTTGVIKEKRTTIEGQGNLSAAGQDMPMTTKVTSVTTVKM